MNFACLHCIHPGTYIHNTVLPQKSMHKLQLAQNSAARLISQTLRHHHITPILIELNWLTITKRC